MPAFGEIRGKAKFVKKAQYEIFPLSFDLFYCKFIAEKLNFLGRGMRKLSKLKRSLSYIFILLMPISISTPSVDSAQTTVQIYGDIGQYALIARDCSDQVLHKKTVPFNEAGAGISHRFNKNFAVAAQGQVLNDMEEHCDLSGAQNRYSYSHVTYFIFTPSFYFDFKYLGFGVAYSYFSRNIGDNKHWLPGGFVRLGPSWLNFRTQLFYDQPMYLNGLVSAGLSSIIFKHTEIFVGLNFTPYDKKGALIKMTYQYKSGTGISAILRMGRSCGIREYAFGLGLRWKLH